MKLAAVNRAAVGPGAVAAPAAATPPPGAARPLDSAEWASCKSPTTYKKLRPGKHTFQVRATASGLTGPVTNFKVTVRRPGRRQSPLRC